MKTLVIASVSLFAAIAAGAGFDVGWPTAFMVAVACAAACGLVVSGSDALRHSREALQGDYLCMRATWHAIMADGPVVRFLQTMGLAAAIVWLSVVLVMGIEGGSLLLSLSLVLLASGAAVSISLRAGRIVKLAWAALAGKILALTLGAALIAFSLALAKRFTHALVHIDPRYLAEFTSVLAACILPYVCAVAALGILLLYGCGQMVVFTMNTLVTGTLLPFMDRMKAFSPEHRGGDAVSGNGACRHDDAQRFARIMGTLALVYGLSSGTEMVDGLPSVLAPYLKQMAVFMEYRTGNMCPNLQALPVVYMDDNLVSVARFERGDYRFTVEPCRPGPDDRPAASDAQ